MLNVNVPGINVRSYMSNRAILQMVMNIHLVPGRYTSSKMSNGEKLQSRLGGSAGQLTVQKSGWVAPPATLLLLSAARTCLHVAAVLLKLQCKQVRRCLLCSLECSCSLPGMHRVLHAWARTHACALRHCKLSLSITVNYLSGLRSRSSLLAPRPPSSSPTSPRATTGSCTSLTVGVAKQLLPVFTTALPRLLLASWEACCCSG